jgi:hypothetical protein
MSVYAEQVFLANDCGAEPEWSSPSSRAQRFFLPLPHLSFGGEIIETGGRRSDFREGIRALGPPTRNPLPRIAGAPISPKRPRPLYAPISAESGQNPVCVAMIKVLVPRRYPPPFCHPGPRVRIRLPPAASQTYPDHPDRSRPNAADLKRSPSEATTSVRRQRPLCPGHCAIRTRCSANCRHSEGRSQPWPEGSANVCHLNSMRKPRLNIVIVVD